MTLGEEQLPLWVDDEGFVHWQFPATSFKHVSGISGSEVGDSDTDSSSDSDDETKKWSMKSAFLSRPDRLVLIKKPHLQISWDIIGFNMTCSSKSGLFAKAVEMLDDMMFDYMWSGGGASMRREAVARITRRMPDIETDTPCDASEHPDNECGLCRRCCQTLADAATYSYVKSETWEAPKEREGVSAKSRATTGAGVYTSWPLWLENRWMYNV